MNIVILNRIETTAADAKLPRAFYICNKCGYANITLNDNYCPRCGNKIDIFHNREKE